MNRGNSFVAGAHGALIGPAPWAGRVLSVHPRAINVLREDGLAVSIVADRAAMSAMGILADGLFAIPPNVELAGTPVNMARGVISFDDILSVNCVESPAWEGRVDAAAVRRAPLERIHALRTSLASCGNPGGLLGVLLDDSPANPFVTTARNSLKRGAAEDLVGCGPGLTPAGDDFLAGAMLAFPETDLLDRMRLERALAGTTPLGRTLLWMALQGRFPAYLVDFLDVLISDGASPGAIHDAARAACAHGETSGTDSLAGFGWAMLRNNSAAPLRAAAGAT